MGSPFDKVISFSCKHDSALLLVVGDARLGVTPDSSFTRVGRAYVGRSS